jgi:phage baseplate assembly protein gpV
MKNAEEYADIVIRDEREKIVSEKPTVYNADKIERIYEFTDGAIIKYEWQSQPSENAVERYNHKFTLTNAPSPNPNKFKTGVVKVIDYPA